MLSLAIIRLKFRWRFRGSRSAPLASYLPLWRASDAVYVGPVGSGARVLPEAEALARVSDDRTIADEELVSAMSDADAKVVVYCFEALRKRRSPRLQSLPDSIISRREKVRWAYACLEVEVSIRDLTCSPSQHPNAS